MATTITASSETDTMIFITFTSTTPYTTITDIVTATTETDVVTERTTIGFETIDTALFTLFETALEIGPQTICPTAVPSYASFCSGTSRHRMARSCFGVTQTAVAMCTPTATTIALTNSLVTVKTVGSATLSTTLNIIIRTTETISNITTIFT